MNSRTWSFVVFALLLSLLLYGYAYNPVLTEIQYVKAQNEDVSIFDLGGGSQEFSPAFDVFASFLSGGFGFDTDSPYLAYPSAYSGVPGTNITLFGEGFSTTADNIVFFGDQVIRDIVSPTGTAVVFTVPDVQFGEYNVFVLTGGAVTNSISFIVLDSDHQPPSISFLDPASGIGRVTVTIHGSGFSTTTGNTIMTGYDIRENVVSFDGTTLVISMLPPNAGGDIPASIAEDITYIPSAATAEQAQELVTGLSEDMWIYVLNENGFSNPAVFQYYYDKTSF